MTVLMVEHRVEDVLNMRPDRVMFMEDGAGALPGAVDGLAEVVNYHEIKLPAPHDSTQGRCRSAAGGSAFHPRRGSLTRQPLVRFENVSFGYERGEGCCTKSTWTSSRGDVIAVLGPNGAGKTTLVKHAIGLLKPRAGGCWSTAKTPTS